MTIFRTYLSRPLLRTGSVLLLTCGAVAAACDSAPQAVGDGDSGGDGDVGSGGDGGIDLGGDGDGDLQIIGGQRGDGDGDVGIGGGGPVCETSSSEAELAPILLAFAFDVSGSMGKYDRPNWWHDPIAKWTPVRQATQAFFEDQTSEGISASMGFFPAASASCDADAYQTPDVAMVALPAAGFATAFNAYESEVGSPLAGGDWRGGTPTLAAFTGTSTYLSQFQAADPEARVAVVLVTDGLPQGCSSEEDDVATVTAAVANLYNAGTGVRTYVIGIENPTVAPTALPPYPGWTDWGTDCDGGNTPCVPPDTLGALNGVAAAGGTTEAFLIDTDDPDATKAAFRAAIDAIRTQAISCELGIPPHPTPGRSFDKDKIDVTYTVDATTTRLDYDPECEVEGAWHYDDAAAATMIVLCPATCEQIRATPGADLNVNFLCEDRPPVVR